MLFSDVLHFSSYIAVPSVKTKRLKRWTTVCCIVSKVPSTYWEISSKKGKSSRCYNVSSQWKMKYSSKTRPRIPKEFQCPLISSLAHCINSAWTPLVPATASVSIADDVFWSCMNAFSCSLHDKSPNQVNSVAICFFRLRFWNCTRGLFPLWWNQSILVGLVSPLLFCDGKMICIRANQTLRSYKIKPEGKYAEFCVLQHKAINHLTGLLTIVQVQKQYDSSLRDDKEVLSKESEPQQNFYFSQLNSIKCVIRCCPFCKTWIVQKLELPIENQARAPVHCSNIWLITIISWNSWFYHCWVKHNLVFDGSNNIKSFVADTPNCLREHFCWLAYS